ncbi:glycoside hydrolase family 16 protein [Amniculicola lignicola CBS 123094]|uniref:chitinase n=1 Tax=Amniculicola lignicola CBS 123094 TaxID=1392246 RepID=A0A6A5WXL5_9PLEO|nr:glycoside hydrolase family 16 protein [Amniculicola lignicola CBS 123094]
MLAITLSALAVLAGLLPTALAQTHTDCNPLNTTGCPDMPALGGNYTFDFNKTMSEKIWTESNQGSVDRRDDGTTFTIEGSGDAPTLKSTFYLFFGRVSIIMKAANGQGIVSSAILQSECLDEIDWEFLGSNTTHVMTNYFGKGNTTDYTRGKEFAMAAPQEDFHNYTLDWTAERIQWWLDGKMLRELKYGEALGGKNYPQTPMNIRLGSWSGGDVKNNDPGVVEWAGGATDFKKGPFVMTVREIYAEDYHTAKTYSWANMDATGDWQKVKVVEGKSESLEEAQKPHGVKNRIMALSQTAKIAIAGGVLGFVLILSCFITICCVKQRRAGRKEFAEIQAQEDKEAAELREYKNKMAAGHFGYAGGNRV